MPIRRPEEFEFIKFHDLYNLLSHNNPTGYLFEQLFNVLCSLGRNSPNFKLHTKFPQLCKGSYITVVHSYRACSLTLAVCHMHITDIHFFDRHTALHKCQHDEYRRKYELDLIKEMSPERKKNRILAVMNTPCEEAKSLVDYTLEFSIGQSMENVVLGFAYILFAQTLAVLKSLSLGITPDNPCPTGEVNRVVEGVTLYPYTLK